MSIGSCILFGIGSWIPCGSYIVGGGGMFAGIEGWRYVDGLYFATVTLTTVGYGDLNPLTGIGRFLAIVYCLVGFTLVLGMLLSLTSQLREIATTRAQLFAAKLGMSGDCTCHFDCACHFDCPCYFDCTCHFDCACALTVAWVRADCGVVLPW